MSRQSEGRLSIELCGLIVIAAALRVRALFTDFWFDEIRSYEEFARPARSVRDIFFNQALKHDNNHHLNTIVLYLLRDQAGWVVYRLPSFVSGLLVVAVAAMIGNRRGRIEGLLSGLLVAGSFMMVVYSTEARGYAFVLLFALIAFVTLQRYLDSPTKPAAALFWVAVAFGLAAHSSMSHFYLGALLWSGYRLRQRLTNLAWLHVVPIAYGVLWAALVLWGSRIGGGDPWRWRPIADESLAWTLGYPLSTVPAALAILSAAALAIWDARRLWVEGSDEGLFFVAVIFGPPIFVAALAPPWLFPRYFLMSLLFLLLVAARTLAQLWQRPVWGKPLVAAIVVLFLGGNLRFIVPFSRDGRGSASHAVADMIGAASTPEVLVTSRSVDIRSTLPIAFYERKLGLGDRIRYVPWEQLARSGASRNRIDWVIDQSEARVPAPDRQITLPTGDLYVLRRTYPANGPSGIYWFLYQRQP